MSLKGMNNLENIPKKNIFEVPDGYFDHLPMKVQERIGASAQRQRAGWFPALKYALPVILLAGFGIFWYQVNKPMAVEEELARIQSDQLSLFLEDESLSTEELVASMTWSEAELQNLEAQVYGTFGSEAEWAEVINELDLP